MGVRLSSNADRRLASSPRSASPRVVPGATSPRAWPQARRLLDLAPVLAHRDRSRVELSPYAAYLAALGRI